MLKLHNCKKIFKKKTALNGFSCEFDQGIYGLLGPNGSGKTTLMRCICGIMDTDGGNIESDENIIGYLPQNFGMFKTLTVYEMMDYFATLKNIPSKTKEEEIKRCLELVNLTEVMNVKTKGLSGGMIRRAGIAQAIMGDPNILIFDEPTTGLDPEERLRFKNLLKKIKKDKTILISTHIVSDVEAICNQLIVINQGKNIYQGSLEEIRSAAKNKVYIVSEKYEDQLEGNYFIKDRISKDNENFLYVLSNSKIKFGEPAEPGVEDGYLCLLKN